MRKFLMISAAILAMSVAFESAAQMSKEEAKSWKSRLKQLTPEQYKTLLDENKSLKAQVTNLKNEMGGVDKTIADKDDQIQQYQKQIGDLRNELAQTKAQQAQQTQTAPSQTTERKVVKGSEINDQVGIVFKVQIGAFRNKDLSKYLNSGGNFGGETDESGLKTYTLGVFTDYWEADTFKKYLREMGVKDAWIVSFKDGKKVPIKEVLEAVNKS